MSVSLKNNTSQNLQKEVIFMKETKKYNLPASKLEGSAVAQW